VIGVGISDAITEEPSSFQHFAVIRAAKLSRSGKPTGHGPQKSLEAMNVPLRNRQLAGLGRGTCGWGSRRRCAARVQPAIAQHALELRKPVFLETPLAADFAGAQIILEPCVTANGHHHRFQFSGAAVMAACQGYLGLWRDRRVHNVVVTWNFANPATRLHLESWKTRSNAGGGFSESSYLLLL